VEEQADLKAMKNIGLITYHATHNYGAALQAYATQKTIEKKGFNCEIINFQPDAMKYYNALYKFPVGREIPGNAKNIAVFFYRVFRYWRYDKKRKDRAKKFYDFTAANLKTTGEYRSINELFRGNFNYHVVITGSDQTWNIRCPLWTVCGRTIDYSQAYFLGFAGRAKRASFAASIDRTTSKELKAYRDLLLKYDYITIREIETKERIESIVNKNVHVVLDPVFLLNKEEWIDSLGISERPVINDPYVLLYSLHGNNLIPAWLSAVKQFARERGLAVICITPNAFMRVKDAVQIYDAGPLEFLNLYHNASYIFADSFHGVCFSVVFRKSFLALGNKYSIGNDTRKTSLLGGLGLENRIISDEDDINNYSMLDLDYSDYEAVINSAVGMSKAHLENIVNLA
jgi:hypothetical protein